MELNPTHPVTRDLHDHWHKIAALLLLRLGGKVVITLAEIMHLADEHQDCAVVCKEEGDTIRLWIVESEEAKEILRKEGGRPW